MREIGDLSEKIAYQSGRINSSKNGQFKSKWNQYKFRFGILDRYYIRGVDVCNVCNQYLLSLIKSKKDEGGVNGMAFS